MEQINELNELSCITQPSAPASGQKAEKTPTAVSWERVIGIGSSLALEAL